MNERQWSRRRLLASLTATAASLSLAGCTTTRSTGSTLASADGWPMAYHDTASTSAVLSATAPDSPQRSWRAEIVPEGFKYGFSFFPAPVVRDGCVYAGGAGLHVIELSSGRRRTLFPDEDVFGPAVRDGSLFVCSRLDRETALVRRIDLESERVEWKRRVSRPKPRARPLVVDENAVYVPLGKGGELNSGSFDHELLVLNATNGDTQWSISPQNVRYTPFPSASDGTVYVGGDGGALQALGPTCGVRCRYGDSPPERAWTTHFSSPSAFLHPPVVHKNAVFVADQQLVGTRSGHLRAVDRDSGEVLWQRSYGKWVTSPAILDESLYVATRESDDQSGSSDVVVRSLTRNGDERWKSSSLTGRRVFAPPVLGESKLFVGTQPVSSTEQSKIHAVDPESGDLLWEKAIPTTPAAMALADGVVVTAGWDGPMVALLSLASPN